MSDQDKMPFERIAAEQSHQKRLAGKVLLSEHPQPTGDTTTGELWEQGSLLCLSFVQETFNKENNNFVISTPF